jgi:FtsP/CotA-like multicopper oxidase with cupredoxin domain
LGGLGGIAFSGWSMPAPVSAAEDVVAYKLTLRPAEAELLEANGPKTAVWAYDGKVPGPLLRARRGQRIRIDVTNSLTQPTSVHWHGIRIVNAMDGVADLTQKPIATGETFVYDFVVPDAGTYWYHSHNRSWEQVARGLYGPLIIDEADAVEVDRDIVIMADDWRLRKDGKLDEDSFGNVGERAHGGRLGNVLTLNGKPYETLEVMSGERVRLRLINAANARILQFRIAGVEPVLVALDGQPVEPQALGDRAVRLAPAQRADLVIDVKGPAGTELAISEVSGSEPLVAGYLLVKEAKEASAARGDVSRLPDNALPLPNLAGARQIELKMTGGAMRFFEKAIFKGKELDGRTLARQHGQVWAFNGVAGTALEPLFAAAQGETVVIRMTNDTLWPHAMHVHGHHFVETGRKPANTADFSLSGAGGAGAAPWRDTVLMNPGEEVSIAFVADNPGDWLLHCHMLEHSAGGMITWFEVNG